jgi:hypothetical protein
MSNPGIFLIQPDGDLVEMNEEPYNSEDLLQTLLARYPSLLAGNQIDPRAPRKWLFIEREASVPSTEGGSGRWSADHLFLDQDAIPTIVEVKRSSDTRIRREVVGQMLDYAANAVVYWPVDRLRERFAMTHGESANERLNEFLDDQMQADEFWQLANKNLQDRNIRLLFVADEIPAELQRIVEFLNEQMDRTEVLAVEIKQFKGGERTGLVPRVIGLTAEAQQKKMPSGISRAWNEDAFLEAMNENAGPVEAGITKKLFDWTKQHVSRITWGKISFSAVLDYGMDFSHIPFVVYAQGKTPGKIEIPFKRMERRNPPFDDEAKRSDLLRKLNDIPGVNLPPDSIGRYPTFSMSALVDEAALRQFFLTVEWTIEQVRSAKRT